MADPSSYRPKPGQIPDSPGVYKFRDEHRRVIYVGKAKSLRQRLSSYFQDITNLHQRTATMVTTAASVEWTVVSTEVEALQLEYSWIKEFDPRFNVKYRDDKSYPSLAVTMNEEFPRVQVMRGPKRKGVRYFGPYAHAWAIRETVDLLLRVFPVRTCSAGVFKRSAQIGRPCLLGYIGKCSAPCVGRISPEDHRELAEEFCDFMAGHTGTYLRRLERGMKDAAAAMEYEQAARLRDDIEALRRAMEKNAVVLADATDADLIAVAEDELEAAVQIFHVRGGRVRGQRGWVTDKVEAVDTADLVEHAVQQLYGDERGDAEQSGGSGGVPKEVLVPALPEPVEPVAQWLAERRGSHVSLRVPQRGRQEGPDGHRAAQRAAGAGAAQDQARLRPDHPFARAGGDRRRPRPGHGPAAHRVLRHQPPAGRRRGRVDGRLRGRPVPQERVPPLPDQVLRRAGRRPVHARGDLPPLPPLPPGEAAHQRVGGGRGRRGGVRDGPQAADPDTGAAPHGAAATDASGGATADGPADGPEDGSAVGGPIDPDTGRPRKFAYPPQLVVVDGGQPQVAAARRALDELGIDDVAVCGLAKRLEEVWLPGEDDPVILPRTSEGLYLLQRVRDEAHRFAITYQRSKRSKSMKAGALDTVPGLGDTRRQALLKHFGSLKRLRSATVEEICQVPGIGRRTAETVAVALAAAGPAAPAVNTATGEIIEDSDGASAGSTAAPPDHRGNGT